jgi:nitrite reductase/ring-hydroxylating ferredoxin subunit
MVQTDFVEVAKISEIPSGKMKRTEVNGKEIMIANVNGKFYALTDRCGHMNALLSMGNLTGNTVTCPFHGAKFDVTTGKKLTEPILTPPPEMEPSPTNWQKFFENVGQLMSHIKTYDQTTYETRLAGDRIKIKI